MFQTYFVYGTGKLEHPVREPHADRASASAHVRRCAAQLTPSELAEGDHYFYREVPRVALSTFRPYREERTMPSTTTEAAIENATLLGQDAGRDAGSWVIDGNTSAETARAILQGIEDCDPEIMDSLPASPLSGEWADGLLPRDVLSWYDRDEDADDADDILRAYEDGYSRGVLEEVARSARVMAETLDARGRTGRSPRTASSSADYAGSRTTWTTTARISATTGPTRPATRPYTTVGKPTAQASTHAAKPSPPQ